MNITKRSKIIKILLKITIVISSFIIYKIIHFNNAIQDSQHSKQTVATQHKIKAQKPISIAIFGVDSDATRAKTHTGQRTDTIVIASINPQNEKTELISVPRDTYSEIPGIEGHEKMAHAYAYGGPKLAMESLRQNLNVPIDGYMTVDMDGFQQLIDLCDSVTVTSNATFNYNGSNFKEGKKVTLSGDKALDYVRSRKETGAGGDEGRTARQRQVIEALGKKLNQSNSLITLNRILKVTENNVQTNLSLGDLKSLYSNYKPALKNMHKATIDGENLIEDDGIWYFEANEDDKSVKINNYKNNLK